MQRRQILQAVAGLSALGTASVAALPAGAQGPARARRQPSPRVAARDGVTLFSKCWGEGRPIVFLHGWALNADSWDYQTSALAEQGFRCIAYDKRGHGRSDQPHGGYDYSTMADDLEAVLAHYDVRGAVVVAHSMAGGEAVRHLTRHGTGRVARLVLVAPTLPFLTRTADNPMGVDATMFEQLRAVIAKDLPAWAEAGVDPFFTPKTSAAMKRWGVEMMSRTAIRPAIECNKAMTSTDFRAELARLTTPTLVLHGDKDASAPLPLTGQRAAELIPAAKLKVYPGAPHGIFLTHIDEVNADIAGFARA